MLSLDNMQKFLGPGGITRRAVVDLLEDGWRRHRLIVERCSVPGKANW